MKLIPDERPARREDYRRQSFAERYPRILQGTLLECSDSAVVKSVSSLASFIAGDICLNVPSGLKDSSWQQLYESAEGFYATEIDFLKLEYLIFHQILLAHRYFERLEDPFAGDKRLDVTSAFAQYANILNGLSDLESAFKVSLRGNAHDASQVRIATSGTLLDFDPWPTCIDREVVDIICDNAGHEFLSDLVLAAYILQTTNSKVRLHVKAMPWFVSDVTLTDAIGVFDAIETSQIRRSNFGSLLSEARESQRLQVLDHPQWTRPINFGEGHLIDALRTRGSMVIAKGDLNYRRCLADVSTEIFKPWQELSYRPDVAVMSLRSVKSHCLAGVPRKAWPRDLDEDRFPMDGTLFCFQSIV